MAPTLRSFAQDLSDRAKQVMRDYRGYGLDQLVVADPEFDPSETTPRINLVILGINSRGIFGGTATALRLLRAIEPFFPRSRMVVVAEPEANFEEGAWSGWTLEGRSPASAHSIVFVSSTKLVVGPGDRFIATHWRTAYYLSSLRKAQAERAPFKPAIAAYLIQDFEPGFYPWGSSYTIADSTYRQSLPTIAVFNTNLLKEYFAQNGYRFVADYAFEPSLHPELAASLKKVRPGPKQRLILVYGRPASPRNAFELAVEALMAWAKSYKRAPEWRVISLGASHKDIQLGPNVVMRSKGKATLAEYASDLANSAIGLSLMISPHPSYPPLEMAEFSVRVLTNTFANKDLSKRSPFITSVSELTPDNLASALIGLCDDFESDPPKKSSVSTGAFLGGPDEFPFIRELAEKLRSD